MSFNSFRIDCGEISISLQRRKKLWTSFLFVVASVWLLASQTTEVNLLDKYRDISVSLIRTLLSIPQSHRKKHSQCSCYSFNILIAKIYFMFVRYHWKPNPPMQSNTYVNRCWQTAMFCHFLVVAVGAPVGCFGSIQWRLWRYRFHEMFGLDLTVKFTWKIRPVFMTFLLRYMIRRHFLLFLPGGSFDRTRFFSLSVFIVLRRLLVKAHKVLSRGSFLYSLLAVVPNTCPSVHCMYPENCP